MGASVSSGDLCEHSMALGSSENAEQLLLLEGSRTHSPASSGFRVQGLGFRVQGLGFRVQGSGFRV